MAGRKLIYIGGWGRSGSTVLANVLGSHADALSVGELRYIWDRGVIADKLCGCGDSFGHCGFWSEAFGRSGIDTEPGAAEHQAQRVGSEATLRQLIAMLTFGVGRYRRRRAAEIDKLNRLYTATADIAGVGTVIDASKTPPYAINLLDNADFDVYFIHLVRDPRAVAYSWSRKRISKDGRKEFLPRYTPLKCAVYWAGFNLLALWFRTRRNVNYLAVRYEDFCAAPRTTVDQILAHCGLAADGLTWHAENVVEVSPQHSISGNPSRFDVGRLTISPDEEWRQEMHASRRGMVTTLCAPLLPVFGYGFGAQNQNDTKN